MNETNAKKRSIYGAIAAALLLAAVFFLLQGRNRTVIFPEFSASDALDGNADCYLNELTVLDRYAEEPNRDRPSEMFLTSYPDRDDREVLISLLVEPDDPFYERLLSYYADADGKSEIVTLSGYFFCEPLEKHNAGAADAFNADADDYIAWKNDAEAYKNPVVLRFAGATEAEYNDAQRRENRGNVIAVILLFVLSTACGIRIFTLREPKPR